MTGGACSAPPLSIVIPTRNRPDMLDACLSTVVASLREDDELIVVDSASTLAVVHDVAVTHGARYIRSDIKGASLARNIGWKQSRHDVIAFIDDDVRVSKDWVTSMSRAFAENPEVSFVTGQVLLPKEQQLTLRPVATVDFADARVFRGSERESPGHSANLAVRRFALACTGGFDEQLGAGGPFKAAEDNDLFDRLFAMGFTALYDPQVLAWHDQWRNWRDLIKLDLSYGFGDGARVSKLLRSDRVRGLKRARALFWDWGLADLGRYIGRRVPFLALLAAMRFIGGAIGFIRAIGVPVRDGHFVPRTGGMKTGRGREKPKKT
jgi:glycosyltransferase involved in cell wall biosynthesis